NTKKSRRKNLRFLPPDDAKRQIDEATRTAEGLTPAGETPAQRERRLAELAAARDRAKKLIDDYYGGLNGADQARFLDLVRKAHTTWIKSGSSNCSITITVNNRQNRPINEADGTPKKVVEDRLQNLESSAGSRIIKVNVAGTCSVGSPTLTKTVESSKNGPTDADTTWVPVAGGAGGENGRITVPGGGNTQGNLILITAKCVCDATNECETATVIFLR
ncbi:MAG: hypothetical protein HY646_03840, partial [Acidobacteria bacterium]|nr:hypothetical protein [Acidobacteriota bacterium]